MSDPLFEGNVTAYPYTYTITDDEIFFSRSHSIYHIAYRSTDFKSLAFAKHCFESNYDLSATYSGVIDSPEIRKKTLIPHHVDSRCHDIEAQHGSFIFQVLSQFMSVMREYQSLVSYDGSYQVSYHKMLTCGTSSSRGLAWSVTVQILQSYRKACAAPITKLCCAFLLSTKEMPTRAFIT